MTDNDTPGLVLSNSELAVTEGASASYTVKLATQPTAEVTVTVTVTLDGTAGTDLSVAANTLTFSATNWSSEQTVTVSAGEDDDALDDTDADAHGRRRRLRIGEQGPAGDGNRRRPGHNGRTD